MAEFLNTESSYAALVDLINKADKKLVLISPYIKIPEGLLERLKDICRRGSVSMTLVCRKEDLKSETKDALAQIPGLQLRFLSNLHAKCFYNDSAMVITSLNLHEHSQQNNREMGIYLTRQSDGDLFLEALGEAEFIVRLAEPEGVKIDKTLKEKGYKPKLFGKGQDKRNGYSTTSVPSKSNREKPGGIQSGYCIRCGKDILHNMEAPYCASCYNTWKRYRDPDYEEEYCHWCGKPNELTTMERPLCYSCYRKLRRNKSL